MHPIDGGDESSLRAAWLKREPTSDPGRYLIRHPAMAAALAERLRGETVGAAPARPAATVLLLRPAMRGPEILLLRRPGSSGFAAGAWVFPGGAVDVEDRLLPAADAGASARWTARLGIVSPDEAWGYVMAALRETWEETGILLGETAAGGGLARERLRRRLLDGKLGFAEAARHLGFLPDERGLVYLAHWITPTAEPRRYDTRFFLASVPPRTAVLLQGDEVGDALWLTPEEALDGYASGQMTMLPPTAHTLRRLTGYPSPAAVAESLRDLPVPAYLPRMALHPDGVIVTVEEVT